MGSISGPGGGPKMSNGCKAHPFLRPGLVWLKDFVAKHASRVIAGHVNKGVPLERACNLFLIAAADSGRVVIQGLAPKRTRYLSLSVNVKERRPLYWTIGTNVEYAIFQEEGTGIYGPLGRPFEIKRKKSMSLPPGLKRGGGKVVRKSGGRKAGA